MPVAKIDDQDLMTLISYEGLKHLDVFKTQSILVKMIRKFEALKQKDPLVAYTYLGIVESYRNNTDLALEYLERAKKIAPNEIVVLNNLAKTYENGGFYVQAKSTYLNILEINPLERDSLLCAVTLAHYYFDVDFFSKLEKINSQLTQWHQGLINLYNFLREVDFNFEIYRVQISIALKVINKYLSSNSSTVNRYFNMDGNYLVSMLELKNVTIVALDQIRNEYEQEIYAYALKQSDGGFEFYDQLDRSVIDFTFTPNGVGNEM